MSNETLATLNSRTLVGFTGQRGNAWHYRKELQGDEPNHYEGAVPVGDVLRRLFNFQVVERPLYIAMPCSIDEATSVDAAGQPVRFIEDPARKAMVADDDHHVMGIFKQGYQGHQYRQWLIDNVSPLLQRNLIEIGSAGLLRERALAWVQVELPSNVDTPAGFKFRPSLLATTSFDGSVATTYKLVITVVVCDNTLDAGLSERHQAVKIKHTRYSNLKVQDAQEALGLVSKVAEDFSSEVERLSTWEVTEADWDKLLRSLVTVPEDSKRGATMAENKRAQLDQLYHFDERASTWKGTALGALQAFNTWQHHVMGTRGQSHAERNMLNAISGDFAATDSQVLRQLELVQA